MVARLSVEKIHADELYLDKLPRATGRAFLYLAELPLLKHTDWYPGKDHNLPHLVKSLAYFDDAESDPMPELYFSASWKSIKAFFRKEVRALAEELLV